MTPLPLSLISKRHSVRSYLPRPLAPDVVRELQAEITMIVSHESGMHFRLVTDDSSPFDGFTASYGFFRNARNYMAAIIDPSFPHTWERAGYFAELLAIKAVESGLGSCFVGGTFNATKVNVPMRAGEKLPFILLLGYPDERHTSMMGRIAKKIIHRNDPDWQALYIGNPPLPQALQQHPELATALKALACAPSSLNKRPVRLQLHDGMITASVENPTDKQLIDLGIAKYNIAAATGGDFDWGNGAALYSPQTI